MRTIPYFILLLSLTSPSVSGTLNTTVSVTSWEKVETKTLNNKIQKSYESGLKWASKPERYIFHLFDLGNLKHMSYEYGSDNIEEPTNIELTLIRDGFLDDSVRGDIQHLSLIKNKENIWEIKTLKKAVSCWRTKKLIYSADACP